jgi:hypothetical protein
MFKVLENPKVNEAFDKIMAGDKRLTGAVDAADALSKLDARVKIEHGILNEDTAAARVGKHREEQRVPPGSRMRKCRRGCSQRAGTSSRKKSCIAPRTSRHRRSRASKA